jgi:hypothetical protein
MRALRIIWTAFWNLVTVAIFLGMLGVASSAFETVVISGLALVYVTILFYGTTICRVQVAQARMNVNQYIQLARMVGDESKQSELNDMEQHSKEEWGEYEKKNVIYYINMAFVSLIWLIAVFSIVGSL